MDNAKVVDADYILNEIAREMAAPSPKETAIGLDDLMAYARWMKTERGYEPSKESLKALLSYMKGYGVMLAGGVGTGKTMFFRSLKVKVETLSPLRMLPIRLEDIAERIRDLDGSEVVVDDIGAEPVYNNFGSRLDLLPWLVEERLAAKGRTHFTTNLPPEDLAERYGARVMDRIRELCKVHTLTGESRRRTRAWKI